VNRQTLDRLSFETPLDLSALLALDAEARRVAEAVCSALQD
jgi:hypothetical protein